MWKLLIFFFSRWGKRLYNTKIQQLILSQWQIFVHPLRFIQAYAKSKHVYNLLSLGRLYKTNRNKKKPISQKTRPTARKADTLSDDRSRRFLSYFVLLGKLYLLVGPGTWTYSHRQKCWKARLLLFTSIFSFPPSPAPGPMSRKSLMFVRLIFLG